MQKITPFLWFDDNAEEAVHFYTSIFPDAEITDVFRWPESVKPGGQVLTIGFRLFGQDYTAMNGGPQAKFNESVSFVVHCDSQEEVDKYWDLLLQDGGTTQACGWLKDKFGLSWQVTPDKIVKMIADKDPEKASRAMQAMMKQVKLDVGEVEKAYRGS